MEKKQPMKKFRCGGITAAIWENTRADGNSFKSVTLQKGYKDKAGDWKNTQILNCNDLPKAIVVLSKAYEAIAFKEEVAEAASSSLVGGNGFNRMLSKAVSQAVSQ